MDDASIRAVLREVGETGKFGTPDGHLSVTPDALAARGVDLEDAATWVEAHGGWVDRDVHRREGLAPDYGKLDVFVRFIVPETALRD